MRVNEKKFGRTGNRGSSGVNFRRWPAKGRTSVSHRRPSPRPRHLPFEGRTASVFAKTWLGREKKPRELEGARRSTKRRSRGARRSTPSPRSGLSSRQDKGKVLSLAPSRCLALSLFPFALSRSLLLPSLIPSVSLRSRLFDSDCLSLSFSSFPYLFLSLVLAHPL
jgi:hypothetical protein